MISNNSFCYPGIPTMVPCYSTWYNEAISMKKSFYVCQCQYESRTSRRPRGRYGISGGLVPRIMPRMAAHVHEHRHARCCVRSRPRMGIHLLPMVDPMAYSCTRPPLWHFPHAARNFTYLHFPHAGAPPGARGRLRSIEVFNHEGLAAAHIDAVYNSRTRCICAGLS